MAQFVEPEGPEAISATGDEAVTIQQFKVLVGWRSTNHARTAIYKHRKDFCFGSRRLGGCFYPNVCSYMGYFVQWISVGRRSLIYNR